MRIGKPSLNGNAASLVFVGGGMTILASVGHIAAIVVGAGAMALGAFLSFLQPKQPEPPVQRHEHTHRAAQTLDNPRGEWPKGLR